MTRRLRMGLLSCAHVHAAGLVKAMRELSQIELVGVYDEDPQRGRALAGATSFFESLDGLLKECEAVAIASTNADHRRYTEAAAGRGVHVLSEKPLATTWADARAMIDACAKAGVQLATAFPVRWSQAAGALREAIEAGTLGRVLAVRGANPGTYPGGWFGDRALAGGGAVMDHTVHVADLLRWLLRDEFVRVEAETGSFHWDLAVEDTGVLLCDMARGAFASIDCSWSRPRTYPTWGGLTLHVVGENATVDVDAFRQSLTHYDDAASRVRLVPWGDDLTRAMVGGFADAILAGRPVPVTGEDGLRALEVALAAYRSAQERRPVRIAEVAG